MPLPYVYKRVYDGTVTAGSTLQESSAYWTADADYMIEKIIIIEKGGTALYKAPTTIRIDEENLTKEAIPASIFNPNEFYSPKLDLPFGKGKTIYFSLTNNVGSDITISIILKLRPKVE